MYKTKTKSYSFIGSYDSENHRLEKEEERDETRIFKLFKRS